MIILIIFIEQQLASVPYRSLSVVPASRRGQDGTGQDERGQSIRIKFVYSNSHIPKLYW